MWNLSAEAQTEHGTAAVFHLTSQWVSGSFRRDIFVLQPFSYQISIRTNRFALYFSSAAIPFEEGSP
jgi:hypothetical protein